jgi:hypothetical protein
VAGFKAGKVAAALGRAQEPVPKKDKKRET